MLLSVIEAYDCKISLSRFARGQRVLELVCIGVCNFIVMEIAPTVIDLQARLNLRIRFNDPLLSSLAVPRLMSTCNECTNDVLQIPKQDLDSTLSL